jgi:hypothetical protein
MTDDSDCVQLVQLELNGQVSTITAGNACGSAVDA